MESATQIRIPRSLTAPDACLAVLLVVYLQYKQYTRRSKQVQLNKAKAPLRTSSIFHELLFTRLSVMVSPSSMASSLGANVVDLHSEDLDDYASNVSVVTPSDKSKVPRKKQKKATEKNKSSSSGVMEVRSRRVRYGELVLSKQFPGLETVMNLSLAVLIGLLMRWVFGLFRSLRLSRVSNGIGGVCCSPFRGLDGDPPGSFERLLACVLIKNEGDEAGKFLLTALLMFLLIKTYKLAWSVTNPECDDVPKELKETKQHIYKRVPKHKIKRFFSFVVAGISALWLFHTPALLRYFGLFGLIEAAEELSARVLLLGNLIGIVSVPHNDPLFGQSAMFQNLTNLFLTALAMFWGLIASTLVDCIQETARNAAFVLSPNTSKTKNQSPDEMMALINTRIMLIIQAVVPLIIISTFFADRHFTKLLNASKTASNASFSKQYLQNSGHFVRAGLSWSFLGASIYCIRTLLQSYLDQASTVQSAMSVYGEATGAAGSKQTTTNQPDPFSDRYAKIVPTAGKITSFPAFIFALLATAHLRGRDISVHPGVGQGSLDALSVSAVKGLEPAYSGEYATRIMIKEGNQQQDTGNPLLQAASISQPSWEETPFRDAAHRKIADWIGQNKVCHTPASRSVKSLGRHVHYLMLESKNIEINEKSTLPAAINGPQLLEFAIPIPFSLFDVLLGKEKSDSSDNITCNADSEQDSKECSASVQQTPTIKMVASSIMSHNIITPTIVIPVVGTLSLLCSIWWTIWYTIMTALYWISIRRTAALRISA